MPSSLLKTACLVGLALLLVPSIAATDGPTNTGLEDPDAVQTEVLVETLLDAVEESQQTAEAEAANAEAQAREAQADAEAQAADVELTVLEATDDLVMQVQVIRRTVEETVVDPTLKQVDDTTRVLLEGEGDDAPAEEDQPIAPASVAQGGWSDYTQPFLVAAGAAATVGAIFWIAGNTAGATAGAASSAAAKEARRLLPFAASPMFTRFERDTVLGHPKREAIYGLIVEKPGITLQDLCDETGLSRTAVNHHLRLMEQQHLLVGKRVGRSRHFFENGGRYGREQKEAYAVLHNDRSKDIHGYIREHPGAIQKDLCDALGIQASVAHWHVKRLVDANLVEPVRQGRTVSYFPAQELPSYA